MKDLAKTKKHWVVLVIVSLMNMGSLGLVFNTMGIYYTPVATDLNILTGTFSMNVTIASIFAAIGSLFAPKMLEKMGWKRTITLGAILSAAGILGMGLTDSVMIFNLLGALRGLGVSFSAMVTTAAILNNWFEEKNGLALSIATASSGIVSVIFSPIFQSLIDSIGWEKTFIVHGILILLLFIPGIFIPYEFRPQDEGLLPYGAKKPVNHVSSEELLKEPVRAKDFVGVTFFAIVIMAFFQTFAVGMGQHLPGYSASIGASPQVASFTLSAVMIGNVSTKLLAGYLSDRLGVLKSIVIFTFLSIFALLLLMSWTSNTGLILSSIFFGTAYAGGVLHVLIVKRFYGIRVGNYVNASIIFVAATAGAIANTVIGYFYDFAGSYTPIFITIVVFQLLAILSLFIAKKYASKDPKEIKQKVALLNESVEQL